MWALVRPWRPGTRPLLADTPTRLLVAVACVVVAALVLASRTPLGTGAMRVVGVAAGHGALLATALAWAGCVPGAGVVAIVLLAAAAAAATLGPAGALAYLAVPLWVAWLARRRRLVALGLAGPVPRRALLAAVLLGAFLGGPLLVSASLTLGVPIRPEGGARGLAALGYDVGAHVLAAECLFPGALFYRAQRRWSLPPPIAPPTADYPERFFFRLHLP